MTFANDIPPFTFDYSGLPYIAVQRAAVNEQTPAYRIPKGAVA